MFKNKKAKIFFLPIETRPKDFPPLLKMVGKFWHTGIIYNGKVYECFNFGKNSISDFNEEFKNKLENQKAVFVDVKINLEKLNSEINSGTDCSEYAARVIGLSENIGPVKIFWPEEVYSYILKTKKIFWPINNKIKMKVVIAGSSSLQDEMKKWVKFWNDKENHFVINWPIGIFSNNFEELYPDVYIKFYKDIIEADILFIANDNKKGIEGYIGAETFAELGFGLAQKLIYKKNIKLILAKMPSKEVSCYGEIILWKKLGWIDEIIN